MLSWVYLIAMARGMAISGGDCLSMAGEPWSVGYFTAMLVMWIIMMVGMMVPSAIPMVLIYASIVRKHPRQKNHVRCQSGKRRGRQLEHV